LYSARGCSFCLSSDQCSCRSEIKGATLRQELIGWQGPFCSVSLGSLAASLIGRYPCCWHYSNRLLRWCQSFGLIRMTSLKGEASVVTFHEGCSSTSED